MKHSPANEGAAPIMRGLLRRRPSRRASIPTDDKSSLHFRSTFDTIINIYNYEKATYRNTIQCLPQHLRVARSAMLLFFKVRSSINFNVFNIKLQHSMELVQHSVQARLWEMIVYAFIVYLTLTKFVLFYVYLFK